jgi:hypothetical protein
VLTLVVFAYEFHLREDGTRGVVSKIFSFEKAYDEDYLLRVI